MVKETPMAMTNLIPMLCVSDVRKSLDFYRDTLGFELESPESKFEHDGVLCWCSIRSGQTQLMLTSGHALDNDNEQKRIGRGSAMFYFYPDDLMALFEALKTKGYEVSETRVTFYRMKEFELRDPDGYTLWFGQPTDEPATDCD